MNDAIGSCRKIIQEHSKSFSLAARLLPARYRNDAVALYAWCRRADDAIDHFVEDDAGLVIHRLRSELESLYRGESQADVVLAAFQSVALGRRIPLQYPIDLLDGMQMDAEDRRYETIHDLIGYCHRVAGVVGLMMCHVLGVRDDQALPHAAHLGIAMQLTNICRDVEEDLARGRCYLPAELLPSGLGAELRANVERRAGEPGRASGHRSGGAGEQGGRVAASISTCPLAALPTCRLTMEVRRGLRDPVRRLLRLADQYYESADRGMRYLDWRASVAIRTARLVYWGIGRELARRRYDVGVGRAYVSTLGKVRLTANAVIASLVDLTRPLPARADARIPGAVLQCHQAVALDPSMA